MTRHFAVAVLLVALAAFVSAQYPVPGGGSGGGAAGATGPTGPTGATGPTGPTGPSAGVKTLYYSPAAKNISGTGVPAYQCISNCPSPSAISSGTAATAELLVTTVTSNQTSQDQFVISQAGYSNQTITVEITWRTSDTNVAHTATVTPTWVCVGAGDVANPTFAAAGGAITLTPPGNTNRTVTTSTFTPSGCATGNEAFWLLSYNTTSGGGGAITNLGILSVRFYATF